VGADLGVGVMVDGPQLDDVLDESEISLDDVLGAIRGMTYLPLPVTRPLSTAA
jgi:hypothetical protein